MFQLTQLGLQNKLTCVIYRDLLYKDNNHLLSLYQTHPAWYLKWQLWSLEGPDILHLHICSLDLALNSDNWDSSLLYEGLVWLKRETHYVAEDLLLYINYQGYISTSFLQILWSECFRIWRSFWRNFFQGTSCRINYVIGLSLQEPKIVLPFSKFQLTRIWIMWCIDEAHC